MISTSFITGTGFIKWIPITFDALSGTVPAIFDIEIDEVFEAKIVCSLVCLARSAKICFFNSKFSDAASITKSAFFK